MAVIVWGNFATQLWAVQEPLYGPQPEIGQQVFGRPLDIEPVAWIHERTNVSLAASLGVGFDAYDNLRLTFSYAGLDLDGFFMIPYHLSILLREDDDAPGTGGLISQGFFGRGSWCQFTASGDFDLPLIWAESPRLRQNTSLPFLRDEGDYIQSYDYGLPVNRTTEWGHRTGSGAAGFSLNFQLNPASSVTSWKNVGLRPRFEALLFPRNQLGHSAFLKHFVTQPGQRGRFWNMSANNTET